MPQLKTRLRAARCALILISAGLVAYPSVAVQGPELGDAVSMGTISMGSVSGTVVNVTNGNGIDKVDVELRGGDGEVVASGRTDASGQYVVDEVTAGAYFVTTANIAGFQDELYDDIACLGGPSRNGCDVTTGTTVEVVAGSLTSGIDFQLTPLGTIAGTVTDAATGLPIPSADVIIRQGDHFATVVTTDVSGRYSKPGVFPGTYTVRTGGPTGYLNELHDDRLCQEPIPCDTSAGDPVEVRLAETTVVDFALDLGGSLSGTVVDEVSGELVREVAVVVWNTDGVLVGYGITDTSGVYTVAGLVPGLYFATAENTGFLFEIYVEETWDDLPCPSDGVTGCDPTTGDVIEVALSVDTPGIDFALRRNGSISGRVTSEETGLPIPGSLVALWNADGQRLGDWGTDEEGRYSFAGLAPGSYFVTASGLGLAEELYDDLPCPPEIETCDPIGGTPVVAEIGQATTGIDLSLKLRTGIEGVVSDEATGQPLQEAGIDVWAAGFTLRPRWQFTLRPRWQTTTNAQGRYSVGLEKGTFRVSTDNRRGAMDEIYDDVPCPEGPAVEGLCDVSTGAAISIGPDDVESGVDFALVGATCLESGTAACLNRGRFRVEVAWRTLSGTSGSGQARELTGDSGYFWFFNEDNVELVIKILDGCFAPFDSFWVFAAGLTDVEVEITVTDTVSGAVKTYTNPLGSPFQPILDTAAFATCNAKAGAAARAEPAPRRGDGIPLAAGSVAEAGGPDPAKVATCFSDDDDLCLNDSRFRVEVFWTTPAGASGRGQAVELTSDTGYFWFFSEDNVEAVVKILDACALPGFQSFWVFAAGLTDVEVTLRVTDTVSGEIQEYHNSAGTPFRPILDTAAFATCP